MGKGPQRNQELECSWRGRVARHRESGQTVRAFCQSECLKESSFYAWRRELSRRDEQRSGKQSSVPKRKPQKPASPSSPFLPITLAASVPIEITLAGNVSVRVAPSCDESLLKMVLSVLEPS